MSIRTLSWKRMLTLFGIGAVFFVSTNQTPAEPIPSKNDRIVSQFICEYLRRGHLNQPPIGDEISQRMFRRFLKDIDPAKLYFTKADIDEFKKDELELDDMCQKGDLSFAYKVYEKFMERLAQRQKLVDEFVKAEHDFSAKESMNTDFDTIEYAKNDDELRERWRKRIKFDLLVERLATKPLPEAEAKQKVHSRYQGQLKRGNNSIITIFSNCF